jgi:hypothetical protein
MNRDDDLLQVWMRVTAAARIRRQGMEVIEAPDVKRQNGAFNDAPAAL